jgi:predicted nucleic acid-binding protein
MTDEVRRRRRIGHAEAVHSIENVEQSSLLAVLTVDEAVEQSAWIWLRRHDERAYSVVDATSFAAMRRERITEALAFDGDFSAAGFVELRPN